MGDPAITTFARSQGPHSKEHPGVWQAPWLAIILLLIVVMCMGASAGIIIVSDKQTVASWKIQPTVLLAVFSSISNIALATAFSIGVSITWWRSVLHGTTLAHLHYIWNCGVGPNFISAFTAGVDARKVMLAAATVAMVKLMNNPLLQRATHMRTQDIVMNETMMLDLSQRIPDGLLATVGDGSPIGSGFAASTLRAWYRNETITSRKAPEYYCDGKCEGKVRGAGISYNCSSTTEALDLSTAKNDGSVIFAINFTMSTNSTGAPALLLTTLHPSVVSDSCVATLRVDTCSIEAGIVEYPITIHNSTVTLNHGKLQDMTVVSTYSSAGDLPTAPLGAGVGPLVGLVSLCGSYLNANITESLYTGVNMSIFSGTSIVADIFFDVGPSSYDNHTFTACSLTWSSPTGYVINSLHEFMFRAALLQGNGIEVQTFTVQRTSNALLFHSDHRYLSAALSITIFALLAVLFLLWGWWELGRHVSLSPLETAKALGAQMMQITGQNLGFERILKENGGMRVKYSDEGIVHAEKGYRGEVRDHETKAESGVTRCVIVNKAQLPSVTHI